MHTDLVAALDIGGTKIAAAPHGPAALWGSLAAATLLSASAVAR
ncbi:hypothetical protein ACWEGQ_31325 [Streptomyces seoulensis]